MAESCCSSTKDRAKGTPKKRADVVMTQAPLPLKDSTLQAVLEMALTRLEIQPRVVGGTMSRRAYRRSVKLSLMASKSESLEISESAKVRRGLAKPLLLATLKYPLHRLSKPMLLDVDVPVSEKSSSSNSAAGFCWKCSSSTSVRTTIVTVLDVNS